MAKAVVFFAEGTEECEALLVVDLLRRAKVEVLVASASGSREYRRAAPPDLHRNNRPPLPAHRR